MSLTWSSKHTAKPAPMSGFDYAVITFCIYMLGMLALFAVTDLTARQSATIPAVMLGGIWALTFALRAVLRAMNRAAEQQPGEIEADTRECFYEEAGSGR